MERNQLQQSPPVKQLMTQRMAAMLKAIPGEQAQTRFRQAALSLTNSPWLQKCSPESVLSAVYTCARLNLIPDPALHLAAVVPFKNSRSGRSEATLIIEYRGFVELAKRADPTISIKAGTVYENDDYTLEEGTVSRLVVHKRWWEKKLDEPGEPLFFYAVSQQKHQAEPLLTIISAVEARRIGRASKAGMKPGTPWHDHFERMGEKTAVRRSTRFWQLSPEKQETRILQEALQHDEMTDENADQPPLMDEGFMDRMDEEAKQGIADDLPAGDSHISQTQRGRAKAQAPKQPDPEPSFIDVEATEVPEYEEPPGEEAAPEPEVRPGRASTHTVGMDAPAQQAGGTDLDGPPTIATKQRLAAVVKGMVDAAGFNSNDRRKQEKVLALVAGGSAGEVPRKLAAASERLWQKWIEGVGSLDVEVVAKSLASE